MKAVLLDFYGTLARAVAFGRTFGDVFAERGLRFDDAEYITWAADAFDGLEHREHSASRERYIDWEMERLRQLAADVGVNPIDTDELVAELYECTKDFTLAAYDEVPDVLSELKDRGVTLAVCSNWGWDLDQALEQAGLDGFFDVVVTSAQAGARKPHPSIYRQTLEQCGVGPEDAVFVGDSWLPDVEGPRAAGLRPVHVWRPERALGAPLQAPAANGVSRIPDLRPLPAIV